MPVIDYKAKREAYEDQHFTKQIDCPEHPGQHKATLFCQGHRFAGIWECDATGEGISDSHDHYKAFEDGVAEQEIETVEVDDSHPDRSDGYSYPIYVCGGEEGCGTQLEGDPREDAADAETDRQIDEMRECDV